MQRTLKGGSRSCEAETGSEKGTGPVYISDSHEPDTCATLSAFSLTSGVGVEYIQGTNVKSAGLLSPFREP